MCDSKSDDVTFTVVQILKIVMTHEKATDCVKLIYAIRRFLRHHKLELASNRAHVPKVAWNDADKLKIKRWMVILNNAELDSTGSYLRSLINDNIMQ